MRRILTSKHGIQLIRSSGKAMARTILKLTPQSRERSLALTKLEEAVMWANAAIARNETDKESELMSGRRLTAYKVNHGKNPIRAGASLGEALFCEIEAYLENRHDHEHGNDVIKGTGKPPLL